MLLVEEDRGKMLHFFLLIALLSTLKFGPVLQLLNYQSKCFIVV